MASNERETQSKDNKTQNEETKDHGSSSKGEEVTSSQVKTKKAREPKNWDKIIREFEEQEKNEPREPGFFFKDLYAMGDDDLRRAMNKSFVESDGTTLSTNWSEVGKAPVKPYESKDKDNDD